MKKLRTAIVAILCLSIAFWGAACGNGGGKTLAKVGNVSIGQDLVSQIAAFVVINQGYDMSALSKEEKSDLNNQVLIYLVDNELLKAKYKASDVITSKVSTAITSNINDILSQTAQDGSTIKSKLQAAKVTEDALRAFLESQYYFQKYSTEVSKSAPATDAEINQYYEANKDASYSTPGSIKVAHILVGTSKHTAKDKALAESIRKQAAGGSDFTKLVTKYSVDTGTKDSGGDYTVTKGDSTDPAFAAAAFKLKKGEISGVVESQFGFHIIKALGNPTKTQYQPLSEAKSDITSQLIQEHTNTALEKLEKQKKSEIKWFVPLDKTTGLPIVDSAQKKAAAAQSSAAAASGAAVSPSAVDGSDTAGALAQ